MSSSLFRAHPDTCRKRKVKPPRVLCREKCKKDYVIRDKTARINLQGNAVKWVGLDKFDALNTDVNWNECYHGKYVHKSCKTYIA